jgi:uncharacterized membrane protein YgdD (TMEM256/DUF423 family)
MPADSSERQSRLLIVVVVCVAVFVGDLLVLNIRGEVSDRWWPVAVPGGLLVVPVIGIASFVMLLSARRGS